MDKLSDDTKRSILDFLASNFDDLRVGSTYKVPSSNSFTDIDSEDEGTLKETILRAMKRQAGKDMEVVSKEGDLIKVRIPGIPAPITISRADLKPGATFPVAGRRSVKRISRKQNRKTHRRHHGRLSRKHGKLRK
jgi:CelD/BcsL family acetyltransferase involved in cellulose biosynthesis